MAYVSELPKGFSVDEGMIGYAQVHRLFAASNVGQELKNRTRFLTFKPSAVPEAEWGAELGAQGNGLQHLWESHRAAREILLHELEGDAQWPQADLEAIQLVALMHDWSALETDHLMAEVPVFHPKLPDTLRALLPSIITDAAMRSSMERAIDRVFDDPSNGLLEMVQAAEALGYGELMHWAWKKGSAIKGGFQEHLRYFALRLFLAAMPGLFAGSRFAAVRVWLEEHRDTLDAITSLPETDIRYFPPDGFPRSEHPKEFGERYRDVSNAWKSRV